MIMQIHEIKKDELFFTTLQEEEYCFFQIEIKQTECIEIKNQALQILNFVKDWYKKNHDFIHPEIFQYKQQFLNINIDDMEFSCATFLKRISHDLLVPLYVVNLECKIYLQEIKGVKDND